MSKHDFQLDGQALLESASPKIIVLSNFRIIKAAFGCTTKNRMSFDKVSN